MEGLGESSLIRLCGEVGLLVAMTMVLAYLTIVARAWSLFRAEFGTPRACGALFFCMWVVCLMLWSNTADVFANSIVTTLGFGLGGASLCSLESEQANEGPLGGSDTHSVSARSPYDAQRSHPNLCHL